MKEAEKQVKAFLQRSREFFQLIQGLDKDIDENLRHQLIATSVEIVLNLPKKAVKKMELDQLAGVIQAWQCSALGYPYEFPTTLQ
jgi:hypothetical protein